MDEAGRAAGTERRLRGRMRRHGEGAPALVVAAIAAGLVPPGVAVGQVRRASMPVTATVPAAPCGTTGADPACSVVVRTLRVADGPLPSTLLPSATWVTANGGGATGETAGGRVLIVVTHVY